MTNKLEFGRLIDSAIELENICRQGGELEKADELRRWLTEFTALVQTLESTQKSKDEETE